MIIKFDTAQGKQADVLVDIIWIQTNYDETDGNEKTEQRQTFRRLGYLGTLCGGDRIKICIGISLQEKNHRRFDFP